MKKAIIISAGIVTTVFASLILTGCTTPENIKGKTGAQLWGENCQRCHNTPSPNSFKDENWEVAGTHMKIKANLTETERDKIVDFLKSAN